MGGSIVVWSTGFESDRAKRCSKAGRSTVSRVVAAFWSSRNVSTRDLGSVVCSSTGRKKIIGEFGAMVHCDTERTEFELPDLPRGKKKEDVQLDISEMA